MREEEKEERWVGGVEDGICLFGVSCMTGRTDGREDGIWYSTSVVTSVIDLEGMIDAYLGWVHSELNFIMPGPKNR